MHIEVTICEQMSVFALVLSSFDRQKKSINIVKQGMMENASLSITKIIINHETIRELSERSGNVKC